MVETRAARRKSMGPPAGDDQKPSSPSKAKGGKKTAGALHWSGSNKGGARGKAVHVELSVLEGGLQVVYTSG